LNVPSRDAFTPLPARGLAVTISGGQNSAQLPEHALVRLRSFSNRYSVRPRESTSTVPRLVFLRPTVAVAPADAGFAFAAGPPSADAPEARVREPATAARESARAGIR
jgi:hypothetical protein